MFLWSGCGAASELRSCPGTPGEIPGVVPEGIQLDGRTRLQAQELGGVGGRQSQGGVGKACGKSINTTFLQPISLYPGNRFAYTVAALAAF